jgi:uncharacterized protein (TIRG00374 family)
MNSSSRAKDIPAEGPPGTAASVKRSGLSRLPQRSTVLRWSLNLLVAGVLLALVLWKVQPGELRDAFGEFELWPAALAIVLNAPVLVLMALRGQFLLRKLGHQVGFLALFPISTFGNVLGAFTPAGAGDLLRTPFFRSRHDIPYAHGVAEVIYERGSSVFILALGTGVATAWVAVPALGAIAVSAAAAAIAAGAPFLVALLLKRVGPLLARRPSTSATSTAGRIRDALAVSLGSIERLLADFNTTVAVAICNGVQFSIIAGQFWLVGYSLGFSLNAAEAWAIFGAALLAGIVTLLPLGIGTFDVVLAGLLGATDQSLDSGAAAVLLVRATITLPMGLAAIGAYLYLMSGAGRSPDQGSPESSR